MNYADKLKQKETTLLNLKAQAMAKKQSILDMIEKKKKADEEEDGACVCACACVL